MILSTVVLCRARWTGLGTRRHEYFIRNGILAFYSRWRICLRFYILFFIMYTKYECIRKMVIYYNLLQWTICWVKELVFSKSIYVFENIYFILFGWFEFIENYVFTVINYRYYFTSFYMHKQSFLISYYSEGAEYTFIWILLCTNWISYRLYYTIIIQAFEVLMNIFRTNPCATSLRRITGN